MPTPGVVNAPGNVLVHHPSIGSNPTRIDEQDRGFERPPAKGSVELFNPKVVRRPNVGKTSPQQVDKDKEAARGEAVANAILIGQVVSLSLDDAPKDSSVVVVPT
jgi:hypothetical protein